MCDCDVDREDDDDSDDEGGSLDSSGMDDSKTDSPREQTNPPSDAIDSNIDTGRSVDADQSDSGLQDLSDEPDDLEESRKPGESGGPDESDEEDEYYDLHGLIQMNKQPALMILGSGILKTHNEDHFD